MADLRESLEAAFAEAGVAVPDDIAAFPLDSLEDLVPDKRLRGKCKSALVRLRKSLGIVEHQGASASPPTQPDLEPLPVTPEPIEETAAAVVEVEEDAEDEEEDEPEPVEAAPMSEALAAKFADVTAAFANAKVPVPADPVGLSLDALDEQIEDKAARAKCKSALVKFRRAAEAEGWQPAAARPAKVKKVKAAAPGATAAAQTAGATSAAADAPAVPASTGGDLWLLAGGAWTKLGQASVVPSHADEIVNQKGSHGHLERITNILVLDGKFEVPADLYNTWCYLAHEGMVYRAYYISHVGDVRRGTRTASLKIDESYSFEQFAELYNGLSRKDRPTADDLRKYRFGGQYHSYKTMFAERPPRMV